MRYLDPTLHTQIYIIFLYFIFTFAFAAPKVLESPLARGWMDCAEPQRPAEPQPPLAAVDPSSFLPEQVQEVSERG